MHYMVQGTVYACMLHIFCCGMLEHGHKLKVVQHSDYIGLGLRTGRPVQNHCLNPLNESTHPSQCCPQTLQPWIIQTYPWSSKVEGHKH